MLWRHRDQRAIHDQRDDTGCDIRFGCTLLWRGGFANDILINLGPEADAKAAEVLTPAQAKRLAQIQFQMRGTGVFSTAFSR